MSCFLLESSWARVSESDKLLSLRKVLGVLDDGGPGWGPCPYTLLPVSSWNHLIFPGFYFFFHAVASL